MNSMTQEEGCRLFLALSVIPYSVVRWFVFVGFTTGGLEINILLQTNTSAQSIVTSRRALIQSIMASTSRKRTCKICGLSDGHTLIDCPFKCTFCGKSIKSCACQDSSLVEEIRNSDEGHLVQKDGSSAPQPPAKKTIRKDR